MVGRDAAPHALDADGVEPREGDGEAVPEFLLELGEHALHREYQDAPGTPPGDQLAHQDAGLQRLAEANRIRDQDALPGPGEGLPGWIELIGHGVHYGLVADVDAVVVGNGGAKLALHVQEAVREPGRPVGNEARQCRVQHLDLLEHAQVDRFLLADQLRDAVAHKLVRPVGDHVHAANDPFRVANDDPGAGGGDEGSGGGHEAATGGTSAWGWWGPGWSNAFLCLHARSPGCDPVSDVDLRDTSYRPVTVGTDGFPRTAAESGGTSKLAGAWSRGRILRA